MGQYWKWLREHTKLCNTGDMVELTVPFLDRHNDYLQIYARRTEQGIELSDDGYLLNDLKISGCAITTEIVNNQLAVELRGMGVQLNGSTLEAIASEDDFPVQFQNFVQAMLVFQGFSYAT